MQALLCRAKLHSWEQRLTWWSRDVQLGNVKGCCWCCCCCCCLLFFQRWLCVVKNKGRKWGGPKKRTLVFGWTCGTPKKSLPQSKNQRPKKHVHITHWTSWIKKKRWFMGFWNYTKHPLRAIIDEFKSIVEEKGTTHVSVVCHFSHVLSQKTALQTPRRTTPAHVRRARQRLTQLRQDHAVK